MAVSPICRNRVHLVSFYCIWLISLAPTATAWWWSRTSTASATPAPTPVSTSWWSSEGDAKWDSNGCDRSYYNDYGRSYEWKLMNWNPVPSNATPYDAEDQEAADEYFAMQTYAFEKRMNGTEYYNDYLDYAEKYNNQSWAKYEQYQRNFYGYDNYQEYKGYNGYNSGSSENSNGYNNYQSNNPNYVNSYSANDYYGGYNAANRKQNSAYQGQNNAYYDQNGNYNNQVNGGANGYPYGYDGRYGYSAQNRNYSFDGLNFEQWKYSQLLEKSGRDQHYFLYENGAGCKSDSNYNLTFEYFHVDCGSTGKCTVGQDFLIRGRFDTSYDFPNNTAFGMHATICKYKGSVCWDLGEVMQINVRDYFDANTTIEGHHGSVNYSNYNLSQVSGYKGSNADWESYSEQYMEYMTNNQSRYQDAYQNITGWGDENGYGYHGDVGAGVYEFEQIISLPYILGYNMTEDDLKERWEMWQTLKSEGYQNDQSKNKNYYNYRYGYNPNHANYNEGCGQNEYPRQYSDATNTSWQPYYMQYYNQSVEDEYRKYYGIDDDEVAPWANASWANTTNFTDFVDEFMSRTNFSEYPTYERPASLPTFAIFDDFVANTSQFIIRVSFMPLQKYNYDKSSYRWSQDKLYCHIPFKVVGKNFNANTYFKRAKYKFNSYYRTGIRYFSTFSIVGLLGIAGLSIKKRKIQCCACLDDPDYDDDDDDICSDDGIELNSVKEDVILDDGTVTATDFVSADSGVMLLTVEPKVKVILPPHMTWRGTKRRNVSHSNTLQIV